MDKRLFLAVIAIRFIYAGVHILMKEAFNGGMNTSVFVFYRQAAAAVLLIPLAITLERKRVPSASFLMFFKMFVLSLFGIAISLNTSSIAIRFTSSSLSAATENTIPVITFTLAVLFRMENINPRKLSGITKVLGVVFFSAGIMTVALYKGPSLRSLNHNHLTVGSNSTTTDHGDQQPSSKKWMAGCFLMLLANTEWCLWLVLQGKVLSDYPSKLLFTTIQVVFSTIQSFVIALMAARDFSLWKLRLDVQLVSVIYCGILVTGISFYLQTWCIEQVGPVALATTTPLTLVITNLCLSFLLGEPIELGSVLGGGLLVGGLYCVLFGKRKEEEERTEGSISQDGKQCFKCNQNNDALSSYIQEST